VLNLLYVLLSLSIVVSLFGIVLGLMVGVAIKYPAFTIPVGTLIVSVDRRHPRRHRGGDRAAAPRR
jgi:hypothetical protein